MSDAPDLSAAIEQLAEFFGFDAHYDFTVDGEPFRITYRQFLSPEIEHKLQEAEKSLEDCDKVEITLPDGKKVKGQSYAIPLRRKGVLLKDSQDAQRLIAIWGEEKYRRFEAHCNKTGIGSPEILTAVWAKQDAEYERWRDAASKSATSR